MSTGKKLSGLIVANPKAPQWGRGKVVWEEGTKVHVVFENVTSLSAKILDTRYVTLDVLPDAIAPLLERLPPLEKKDGALLLPRTRIALPDLIQHFLKQFPGGFDDPAYLGEGSLKGPGERLYKVAAHKFFVDNLGSGKGAALALEGNASILASVFEGVLKRQNLLATQEVIALTDALRDESATLRYAKALFRYLETPAPDRSAFDVYASVVMDLPQVGALRVATWPVLTLMPFLAQPTVHMFLKPEVTKKAADIVGFDLAYSSTLTWLTYSRLLELAEALMPVLRPLGARDLIDVQSFIWVAISYP